MILNSTKYKNPERTISGLLNVVSNADTIILCDTSIGAVSIDLLQIPNDQWNTTYKVYIADKSNNASVNNITVNAPVGFTINDLPSLVISINGGSVLVRVASNTGYLGSFSSGAGSSVSVIDEQNPLVLPITLTTNLDKLKVKGFQTSNIGNDVTLNNAFIVLDNSQIQFLIGNSSLIPNQWYNITDSNFGTFSNTHNVYVLATRKNSLSIIGSGQFYNADYNGLGNYVAVPFYSGSIGVWFPLIAVALGNVCIWNNYHYVNLTGVNDPIQSPLTDALNWQILPYNIKMGYILAYDEISYDVSTNKIVYRKDINNNEVADKVDISSGLPVKSALNDFRWGDKFVIGNSVLQDSIFAICNIISIGKKLAYNTLTDALIYCFDELFPLNWSSFASMVTNTFSISNNPLYVYGTVNSAGFNYNIIQNSYGNITTDFNFTKNSFINNSTDPISIVNQGTFQENIFESCYRNLTINNGISGFFQRNRFFNANFTINNNFNIWNNTINSSVFFVELNTGQISYNLITNGNFGISVLNSSDIFYNEILENSFMYLGTNTANIGNAGVGKGFGNIIANGSKWEMENNSSPHAGNILNNTEIFVIDCQGSFVNCDISGLSIIRMAQLTGKFSLLTLVGAIFGNIGYIETQAFLGGSYTTGNGSIMVDLDCSNITVFNPATNTLTIPSEYKFFGGIYNLLNANGIVIIYVIDVNGTFETTFTTNVGSTTFQTIAVGLAINVSEIVSSFAPTPYSFVLVHRSTGNDYIKMRTNILQPFTNIVTEVGIFV